MVKHQLVFLKAFLKSKEYLLKMATSDAVARSKHSKLFPSWDEISEMYFAIHSYTFLGDFLEKQLRHTSGKGIIIQLTTHTSLLQQKYLPLLLKAINFEENQITLLTLQQFDTEVDFCNKIR